MASLRQEFPVEPMELAQHVPRLAQVDSSNQHLVTRFLILTEHVRGAVLVVLARMQPAVAMLQAVRIPCARHFRCVRMELMKSLQDHQQVTWSAAHVVHVQTLRLQGYMLQEVAVVLQIPSAMGSQPALKTCLLHKSPLRPPKAVTAPTGVVNPIVSVATDSGRLRQEQQQVIAIVNRVQCAVLGTPLRIAHGPLTHSARPIRRVLQTNTSMANHLMLMACVAHVQPVQVSNSSRQPVVPWKILFAAHSPFVTQLASMSLSVVLQQPLQIAVVQTVPIVLTWAR